MTNSYGSFGYRNRRRLAPASSYPHSYLVGGYARRVRRSRLEKGATVEAGASATVSTPILHSGVLKRAVSVLRSLLRFAATIAAFCRLVYGRFGNKSGLK